MGSMTVKFIDKEYDIPNDVITYIDLVDFTNDIRDNLVSTFVKKIKDIEVIEDKGFMINEINEQVSRFIMKLIDNDIFDKTVTDYLKNSQGLNLFFDTKEKALQKIIAIRQEKLDVYKSGVQDAIYKKENSVTGLDFGLWTSSFTNLAIYAFLDAREETKQGKVAAEIYNREISELDKNVQVYDEMEHKFIVESFIPVMNDAFTLLSYELLDKYIADLIKDGKFDSEALNYADLERSNDLLKNLRFGKNAQSIIELAFVACPFNLDVYVNAMENGFLNYESFQTAIKFRQGNDILDFLKDSIVETIYPMGRSINMEYANLWERYTGKDAVEMLFQVTSEYVNEIVDKYNEVKKYINGDLLSWKVFQTWYDDAVKKGAVITNGKAEAYIDSIVSKSSWNTLVDLCGHKDLFKRIREGLSDEIVLCTKEDVDKHLKEKVHETMLKHNIHRVHRKQSSERSGSTFVSEKNKKKEEESRRGRLCAVCQKKMHIMTSKVKLKDGLHVCGDCWEKAGFNSWGDILKKTQIYTSDDITEMIYK